MVRHVDALLATPSQYMISPTTVEKHRLDKQQDFLRALSGDELLVSSRIPLTKIGHIADVGTGTGVWLRDVAAACDRLSTTLPTRDFDGFDVENTSLHLHEPRFSFHQQNVLDPWPPAFHGKYGLVHVRLLTLGLKTHQFAQALENIVAIVAPGGYIQWDELDAPAISFHPRSCVLQKAFNIFYQHAARLDRPPNASTLLEAACRRFGLSVHTSRYTLTHGDVGPTEDLKDAARAHAVALLQATLPAALLDGGFARSHEEAVGQCATIINDVHAEYARGVYPIMVFTSTVMWKVEKSACSGFVRVDGTSDVYNVTARLYGRLCQEDMPFKMKALLFDALNVGISFLKTHEPRTAPDIGASRGGLLDGVISLYQQYCHICLLALEIPLRQAQTLDDCLSALRGTLFDPLEGIRRYALMIKLLIADQHQEFFAADEQTIQDAAARFCERIKWSKAYESACAGAETLSEELRIAEMCHSFLTRDSRSPS